MLNLFCSSMVQFGWYKAVMDAMSLSRFDSRDSSFFKQNGDSEKTIHLAAFSAALIR